MGPPFQNSENGSYKSAMAACSVNFSNSSDPELFVEDLRNLPDVRSGPQQGATLVCKVCHILFPTWAALQSHTCPTGRQTCVCKACGKHFDLPSALERHEKTHMAKKRYNCSVCGKNFSGNSSLIVHKRIHTGERPYGCKFCDKRFTQLCGLQYHERTHTGEQPYVCDVCNKSFAASSSLAVHKRTHSGQQPYSCGVCNKLFAASSSLAAHRRTHWEFSFDQLLTKMMLRKSSCWCRAESDSINVDLQWLLFVTSCFLWSCQWFWSLTRSFFYFSDR